MVNASHLSHLGSSLTDAVRLQHLVLYLSQLYAEASQLHLEVNTSQIFYVALFVPTADVASMIHADTASPRVVLYKRTVTESLCRTLRQLPVAASHLNASKAQLSCHALRQQSPMRVDDEVVAVCHRLTDGYVVDALPRSNLIVRRIVGTLRRTIDVDNLDMVAIYAVQLLATSRNEAHGQVVVGVQQQCRNSRRVSATRYLMVKQELPDSLKVFSYFRRHDVERAAQRQDGIHILDMRIERERAVPLDAVVSRQPLHVNHHIDEVPQTRLMQHGTLGLSRGARRIDHISQVVGSRQVDGLGLCAEVYVLDEYHLCRTRVKITLGLLGVQYGMAGDEYLRLRVLEHVLQTLVGIFKVQGCIGSTGLMDGQHAERELLIAVEHHADEVVRLYTNSHQFVGQYVRTVRQLAVCQLAALVNNSHVVGYQLGTCLKDLGKRLGDINVKVFSTRQRYHVVCAMLVEQRYRCERSRLWCLLGNALQQVRQLEHVFLGIQRRIIFQHHHVVITPWSHCYAQRELGLVELQVELFTCRFLRLSTGLERIHDLRTDAILFHHLGKRIEVARLRFQQLVVHFPDSLCHTRRTVGRRAHGRNGLYEHTHRAHHP